ncbi:hypothetical protein J15TS10_23940 [Paenibacillus woosongensis]|uniref:Uncharacterized protein n=1 Tax=Paenibacillus woosongensis TaxID=307580 RepID=A0ABQ4MRE8_9BACL|nr:hypothetical protein J15TS10_23940 [Paenibacillus woosongensis]
MLAAAGVPAGALAAETALLASVAARHGLWGPAEMHARRGRAGGSAAARSCGAERKNRA